MGMRRFALCLLAGGLAGCGSAAGSIATQLRPDAGAPVDAGDGVDASAPALVIPVVACDDADAANACDPPPGPRCADERHVVHYVVGPCVERRCAFTTTLTRCSDCVFRPDAGLDWCVQLAPP